MQAARVLQGTLLSIVASALSFSMFMVPAHAEDAEPPTPEPAPARILLYGDSYTMGFSGDWTARFRLWQLLTNSGAAFDFVGPRNDVRGYMSGILGSQLYRYANFDRDHASLAGMAFTQPSWEMSTLVTEQQADVVVAMIGLNDMVKGLATPEQLADEWRRQVGLIRETNPLTDVVLVPYPTTWIAGVDDYNAVLASIATELDTVDSRVVAAAVAQYDMSLDTNDMVHPSAAGEKKLAAVEAAALAELGIGSQTFAAATTSDPATYRWAPNVNATIDGARLNVRWGWVDYASSMDVVVQDITSSSPSGWKYVAVQRVKGQSWAVTVTPGRKYRVCLLPVKGHVRMGTYSAWATVNVPMPSA